MLAPQSKKAPRVDKWLGVIFHHTHTREGDPHLHSHIILPNIMKNVEGEWRAMQVHIAGINRSSLELAYGHELARQLRRIGLGSSMVMRSNGLPDLRPLRQFVPRFSTAKKAVLSAFEIEEAARPLKNVKTKWDGEELHSRSGLPISPDRIAMRRRQRLADEIRRPKPKDADNPVRLIDEAARWRRALSDQEYRTLEFLLDGADPTNPRREVVLEEMPPSAAAAVRAAYGRIHCDQKPTYPLLIRAAVAESAGRHDHEELRQACEASLITRREAMQRLRARIAADDEAISIAAYDALTHPPVPAAQSNPPTVTPVRSTAQAVQTSTVAAPARGSGRRR